VLASLIADQRSVAVAGSHGKTTTSTLIATLLHATNHDPTAVIGGVVPAFGSNGRNGQGALLVAEADESDGTLVKFQAWLGVITNLELDHTDHYPDLAALIATLQRFGRGCQQLLANRDCPILSEQFEASHWWSIRDPDGVAFAALPEQLHGDGTEASFYENGNCVGRFRLPLPGLHNLSNAVAAIGRLPAAWRVVRGIAPGRGGAAGPGAPLRLPRHLARPPGGGRLRPPPQRSGGHPGHRAPDGEQRPQSPLRPPAAARRYFQPHRYSRTAEFLDAFAQALSQADAVILAPLYAAGEAPIPGISSAALAAAIRAPQTGAAGGGHRAASMNSPRRWPTSAAPAIWCWPWGPAM
jgi:UDP-N-acetylmuramate--alanine ligase